MIVPHSQKGMSVFGWLMTLAFVAFLASALFKVVPHYLDYMSLDKLILSVEADKAAEVRSAGEFYNHIAKGLIINNMRDLDLKEALKIKLENNEYLVHLKYEKRENLIENIDLVTRFEKEYRVRMP
ncbi:MAG: DUF4845 domain-containing protein [Pseudomonas sp.]|uniref:DUF4845 domain-containing protein n=1 Tax=Pseudomonas sp. TaxID=306 RepID=UPI003396CCD2